jgi:hypothetical protein
MKRVLGHCLAGLTLICGGIALTSACAHNDSSLFVSNVLYPTPVSAGQACSFTADPNQTVLSRGTLDVAFGNLQYSATFLIGNQLVAQAQSQNLKTETSIINIEGAIVRVTDAAGNQLDNFTTLAAGTVLPSTGTVPGYASISAVVASQTAVGAIVKQKAAELASGGTTMIVTYVKFFGHTLGGTYIESNDFEYPIQVCETTPEGGSCLVNFSLSEAVECNGVKVNVPNCLAPSSTAMSLPVPCTPGQDTIIDCSQCQSLTVCRGAYPSSSPCLVDAGTD